MNYVKTIVIFLITLVTACTFTRNTSGSFTDSNGDTVIYASKIIHFANGGTEYDFNIDGQQSYTRVPPEGFDFSNATDAQLEFYGIPHDKDRIAGFSRNDSKLKALRRGSNHPNTIIVSHIQFGGSTMKNFQIVTPKNSASTASK